MRMIHSSCLSNEYLTSILCHTPNLQPTATVVLGSNSACATIYSMTPLQQEWKTQLQSTDIERPPGSIPNPVDLQNSLQFTSCKHNHNIPSVSLTSCGKYLASVSIDYSIRIWDRETTKLLFAAQDIEWFAYLLAQVQY